MSTLINLQGSGGKTSPITIVWDGQGGFSSFVSTATSRSSGANKRKLSFKN
jgi:hypothetical protein